MIAAAFHKKFARILEQLGFDSAIELILVALQFFGPRPQNLPRHHSQPAVARGCAGIALQFQHSIETPCLLRVHDLVQLQLQ
jgi:hypothetical protein